MWLWLAIILPFPYNCNQRTFYVDWTLVLSTSKSLSFIGRTDVENLNLLPCSRVKSAWALKKLTYWASWRAILRAQEGLHPVGAMVGDESNSEEDEGRKPLCERKGTKSYFGKAPNKGEGWRMAKKCTMMMTMIWRQVVCSMKCRRLTKYYIR